jgi:hypothetical protein
MNREQKKVNRQRSMTQLRDIINNRERPERKLAIWQSSVADLIKADCQKEFEAILLEINASVLPIPATLDDANKPSQFHVLGYR